MRSTLFKSFQSTFGDIWIHHWERLQSDYFAFFDDSTIKKHLTALTQLTNQPFLCSTHTTIPGTVEITLIAYDFQGFFSIATGTLAVSGFNIGSARGFTYGPCSDNLATDFYRDKPKVFNWFQVTTTQSPEVIQELISLHLNDFLALYKKSGMVAVRHRVNTLVGQFITNTEVTRTPIVEPLDISIDFDDTNTYLKVLGQDTPFFIYTLSYALNLLQLTIKSVVLQTKHNTVDDLIVFTDKNNHAINQQNELQKIKVSVALIKQFFTYLPQASDYSGSIQNFYSFLKKYLQDDKNDFEYLKNNSEEILEHMAKLFGSGNSVWEDFAKNQQENLLPLFKNVKELQRVKTKETLTMELGNTLSADLDFDVKISRINLFKDNELLRLELSHQILNRVNFSIFSQKLSQLADVIISSMLDCCYEKTKERYGSPRYNEQACPYAFMGLGKYGSIEMGYASDLELVFIYKDNQQCFGGRTPASNQEFFNRMIELFTRSYKAKKEGMFDLDLRLRPDGEKGALACSLRRWKEYYLEKESTLSYEKLALTKARIVARDDSFQKEILSIRDSILYESYHIESQPLYKLRQKQIQHLTNHHFFNAKLSRGGLVDIEYPIQYLQVFHGKSIPELRYTNIPGVMTILLNKELISPALYEKLFNGYSFFHRLINNLRIVSGNAKDLELPSEESSEFLFLSRRMKYRKIESHYSTLQSDIEYYRHNNALFYDSIFNSTVYTTEEYLPGLVDAVTEELSPLKIELILQRLELSTQNKTLAILKRILEEHKDQAPLLLSFFALIEKYLIRSPAAEKISINIEYLLKNTTEDVNQLILAISNDTSYLEMVLHIFAQSDFLANAYANDPAILHKLIDSGNLKVKKSYDQFTKDIESKCAQYQKDHHAFLNRIRKYRNDEYVRISLRDSYLNTSLGQIVSEISDLSYAICNIIYQYIFKTMGYQHLSNRQVIIAMGKLGGHELNYSSDIDILFVVVDPHLSRDDRTLLEKVNNRFIKALHETSRFGQLFRVDTNLRPYGSQGAMIATRNHYIDYYSDDAQGWELQIWLKAAPLCGNISAGAVLIEEIQGFLFDPSRISSIQSSMEKLRYIVLDGLTKDSQLEREVKNGPGGIRTIEFYVQRLQVIHGKQNPEIVTGNTLKALFLLSQHSIITDTECVELSKHYSFLRAIEHTLQINGLQQLHLLPESDEELRLIAFKLNYRDIHKHHIRERFIEDYTKTRIVITKISNQLFPLRHF
ncbi:MAG: hypothetical protein OCC49_16970 [Fibrobacterales bacterium]